MDKAEQLVTAIKKLIDDTIAFELKKQAHYAAQVPGEKPKPFVQGIAGSPIAAAGEVLKLCKQLNWN